MPYRDDRSYTDRVHESNANKDIYGRMGWMQIDVDSEVAQLRDSEYSIDYTANDNSGNVIYIQERFRKPYYKDYNDFTLRFERPENPEEIEQKSEFFKMKGKINRYKEPFFMVYGIPHEDLNGFYKVAVIDLRAFFNHYANGDIVIDYNLKFSKIIDNVFHAGHNTNYDHSSTFVCFNIRDLYTLFGNEVVIYQEGFI